MGERNLWAGRAAVHGNAPWPVPSRLNEWGDLMPRLPGPALCRNVYPDLFFPEKGESSAAAKRVCRACWVRAECLEWALEHDIREGVWGETTPKERHKMRKQRREAA